MDKFEKELLIKVINDTNANFIKIAQETNTGEHKEEPGFFSNPEDRVLKAGLIGAALGGLGGFAFSKPDESLSRKERFRKRLKNTLLGIGLGGIGGAGLSYGAGALYDALTEDDKPTNTEGKNNPEFDPDENIVLNDIVFPAATITGAGATAGALAGAGIGGFVYYPLANAYGKNPGALKAPVKYGLGKGALKGGKYGLLMSLLPAAISAAPSTMKLIGDAIRGRELPK